MKKKHILLPFAAALILLTGCNYNDKNFDGLDEMTKPEQVFKLDYTLTDADYATISTNKSNVAIANADGVSADLKAVASNLCLSNVITAEKYVPAFLANKWYTADAGSAIKVTYNVSNDAPEYLAQMASADEYKLTNADYQSVLGEDAVSYFYPSKPAANFLPRILKAAIATPEDGEYVAVEYNYADTDPSTGGEQPGEKYDKIVDALGAPGKYNVKGSVAALYARGFLLTDGTNSIIVYKNALTNLSLGDVVAVNGTTAAPTSGRPAQFGAAELEITRLSGSESFAYPIAQQVTTAELDAYVANTTDPTVKYISYSGTLSISGNYYNVTLEGTTTAIGSISYPAPGLVSPDLNGKEVTVTGYTVGVGGGKYVNTMATSVVAVGETAPTAIGVVNYSSAGDYTVQGQVMDTYARGFLINDGTGSMIVYLNTTTDLAVGSLVQVSGAVTVRNNLRQFGSTATITTIVDGGTVAYPTPFQFVAEDVEAYVEAPYIAYIAYKGTLTIDGNYYNLAIDGTTIQGSISYPNAGAINAELNGKEVVVTGFAVGASTSSSTGTKYINLMLNNIIDASAPAAKAMMTRATAEKKYAMYQYKGGNWAPAAKTIVVNPSDYVEMGLSNNNFSSTIKPANYLPQFLGKNFPYAHEGDTEAVVYNYYDGQNTVLGAQEYNYTSGAWVLNNNVTQVTDQFVFNGSVWNFDPSIVIVLKKNDAYSKEFMLKTVEGVKEHKGTEYIDSYGTGEFFYGSSGYYANVDLSPSKWKQYAPYANMTDEEIRTAQVEHAKSGIFVYSLEYYHADMDVVPGVDVTVTIKYDTYDSSASAGVATIKYLVTGKGKFEYIEGSYILEY